MKKAKAIQCVSSYQKEAIYRLRYLKNPEEDLRKFLDDQLNNPDEYKELIQIYNSSEELRNFFESFGVKLKSSNSNNNQSSDLQEEPGQVSMLFKNFRRLIGT